MSLIFMPIRFLRPSIIISLSLSPSLPLSLVDAIVAVMALGIHNPNTFMRQYLGVKFADISGKETINF